MVCNTAVTISIKNQKGTTSNDVLVDSVVGEVLDELPRTHNITPYAYKRPSEGVIDFIIIPEILPARNTKSEKRANFSIGKFAWVIDQIMQGRKINIKKISSFKRTGSYEPHEFQLEKFNPRFRHNMPTKEILIKAIDVILNPDQQEPQQPQQPQQSIFDLNDMKLSISDSTTAKSNQIQQAIYTIMALMDEYKDSPEITNILTQTGISLFNLYKNNC